MRRRPVKVNPLKTGYFLLVLMGRRRASCILANVISNTLRTSLAVAALLSLSAGSAACEKTTKVGPDAPTAPIASPQATTATAATPGIAMPVGNTMSKLASSSNALGFDLYGRAKATPGNLAMSPTSISAALAMTFGGARGETEAQMKRVLHVDGSRDEVMAEWGKLSRALQNPSRPLKLRIANRLFGEKTVRFEQPFLDATQAAYGAPLEPVDFVNAFEPARGHINGWVEAQTEKRIRELVPAGVARRAHAPRARERDLLPRRLAPAFREGGHLPRPLPRFGAGEEGRPHHAPHGDPAPRPRPGLMALELPYKGRQLSMLVVLPDAVSGLPALEASLGAEAFDAIVAALAPTRVAISLPKFEVNPTESLSLGDVLVAMGMGRRLRPREGRLHGDREPEGSPGPARHRPGLPQGVREGRRERHRGRRRHRGHHVACGGGGAPRGAGSVQGRPSVPVRDPRQRHRPHRLHGPGGRPDDQVARALHAEEHAPVRMARAPRARRRRRTGRARTPSRYEGERGPAGGSR